MREHILHHTRDAGTAITARCGTASLTATESSITVSRRGLDLRSPASPRHGGRAGNVVVTAYDAYGNVATGYTGTGPCQQRPAAVLPSSFPGTTGRIPSP